MDKNKYPKGWNQQRVQEVIGPVEIRTEEETHRRRRGRIQARKK